MLKELHIKNFKAHRDTRIEFGNLTLLAGINSSGKSSLIHALLLLRQSNLKNRLEAGLDLNEPLCRIGTGQDVLHRFAKTNALSIDIATDALFHFSYNVERALNGTFLPKSEYSANVSEDSLAAVSLFNNNFQYVSSLRFGGRSHFEQYDYEVVEQQQISKALGQGECVAHFLHRFGAKPTTNYLFDGNDYALADQVELWLQRISDGITIEIKKSQAGGFDITYGYAFDGLKPLAGLSAENVGYGVSHSLPIIVALLSAGPNSLVILENPEAHLHPRGQAELAKLIARVAQSGVQVIVETHSDHILNGILIATKMFELADEPGRAKGLNRDNVKIYYVDKNPNDLAVALTQEVKIEEGGRLNYQPRGFFDQAEQDLMFLLRD